MILIIQCDPEVPPGNIIDNLDYPHRVAHPYLGEQLPDYGDFSALVILGGSMGANDDLIHPFLTRIKSLIRVAVAAGTPILGICLGGQLLAASLGAKVESNRWGELGTLPVNLTEAGVADPLFSSIAATFSSFQWHNDSFDLPEGALLLASSPACQNQAFRFGNNAWGLQFHPEVTEEIIENWSKLNLDPVEATAKLVADFRCNAESYKSTAVKLMENFLKIRS